MGRTSRAEIEARSTLRERLEARRGEVEAAALTRVNAIADSSVGADPAYVEGLRSAVVAALDFGLASVETGDEPEPPVPVALLAQARVAARSGVSLDTVLRRYFAGYSLLGYFIVEEAGRDGLMSGVELQRLLGSQAVIFDRLLAAIGEEHARESERLLGSSDGRRSERIESLLACELVDTSGISYDFDGWHVAAIASGQGVAERFRDLARDLDLRPLLVDRGNDGVVWAWLGARRKLEPATIQSFAAQTWSRDIALAIGEAGTGLSGWRLTHRQAAAALPIAQRGQESAVRYAEVALLASTLQDDLLTGSLRRLYLAPLESEHGRGEAAKETLRAYFAADRNVSSAAASLGVKRHTVTNRLRVIEEAIGRPLDACAAELDTVLRLDTLARPNPAAAL